MNADQIAQMNADELRAFTVQLMTEISDVRRDNTYKQLKIDQLTHEMALMKRRKFSASSEQLKGEQRHLFEETFDADLEAMTLELKALQRTDVQTAPKETPKRAPLPLSLPRKEVHHEPSSTLCACGCSLTRIGEDISEKLDYTPGVFTVERHVRGKWVCRECETLVQAPVPAHIIDKGIPTAGLLAQVLVAKYQDHLPLYRQEGIFGRAGLAIPQSTLAQWVGQSGVHLQPLVDALKVDLLAHPVLHADETPVAMLDPGAGKTHRAYLWSYSVGAFDPIMAVVYDFADSRAGRHAQAFLGDWRGTLICDDYAGYKALIALGVTEAGCMAHARRKFFDLAAQGQSQIASEALEAIGQLYGVEREAAELDIDARQRLREAKARPILERLHAWLLQRRTQVPNGSGIARAIDYSLKRWAALTHYVDDGRVPIDNNWIENQIRPIALGRKNWLFAGSLRAGQRAAAIMSLIQSARLNGHEPFAYMKDVLERLPTQPYSRIRELLPHRWQPTVSA
jgi:transposase